MELTISNKVKSIATKTSIDNIKRYVRRADGYFVTAEPYRDADGNGVSITLTTKVNKNCEPIGEFLDGMILYQDDINEFLDTGKMRLSKKIGTIEEWYKQNTNSLDDDYTRR